jgi:hypothetical protein
MNLTYDYRRDPKTKAIEKAQKKAQKEFDATLAAHNNRLEFLFEDGTTQEVIFDEGAIGFDDTWTNSF